MILFYFGAGTALGVSRASIIAYFLASDAFGATMMATQGLLTAPVLWRAAVFLPVVGLGIWAGNRRYQVTAQERFRFAVLALMGNYSRPFSPMSGGDQARVSMIV